MPTWDWVPPILHCSSNGWSNVSTVRLLVSQRHTGLWPLPICVPACPGNHSMLPCRPQLKWTFTSPVDDLLFCTYYSTMQVSQFPTPAVPNGNSIQISVGLWLVWLYYCALSVLPAPSVPWGAVVEPAISTMLACYTLHTPFILTMKLKSSEQTVWLFNLESWQFDHLIELNVSLAVGVIMYSALAAIIT